MGEIAVLVVVIIGVGVFGFVVARQKSDMTIVAPIRQPEKEKIVKSKEETNLVAKVPVEEGAYRNEKFGFEITLKNFKVDKEKENEVAFVGKAPCENDNLRCPGGSIYVDDRDVKYPTLDSMKSDPEQYMDWGSDIVLSGERAIRGQSREGSGTSLVYVIHNGKLYTFTWDLAEPSVLATFKFTK